MKLNMGTIDRVARIAIAVAVGVLYYLGMISGTAALVLGAIAVIFILTGAVGFCPLYKVVNLSTRKDA